MTGRPTSDDFRAWATALPEVTEKRHFRFKEPVWQVRGKTFLGMGRDGRTVVFCVTEESADAHATADPVHAKAVRRTDAKRSFLGLEVQLEGVGPELLQALVREAWLAQAPKTLARQHAPSGAGPGAVDNRDQQQDEVHRGRRGYGR